jgi:hypothetical protein
MQKQEKKVLDNLPCAGITLIRFYGFDLSPAFAKHPEESVPTGLTGAVQK